jgi:hypothetical protein
MLLAYHDNWHRVGFWNGVDDRWPWTVAPTADAMMSLYTDTAEVLARDDRTAVPSPTMLRPNRHGICELLTAGLVKAGDEVVWNRRHGVRHTARIRDDGALQLPNGRTSGRPKEADHDLHQVHSRLSCSVGSTSRIGPGYTLEAAAVRLSEDIAELRDEGGIPEYVRTVIEILPQQRVLDIRVEGLSVETDPDRTTIREVTNALFELASYHNIVALDGATPPLFTQRILLVGADGRPVSDMVGAAVGDVEPVTPLLYVPREHDQA